MKLSFEWSKCFDAESEKAYIRSLATLIGEQGAKKLVDIAHIYESHDWMQLLVAKNKGEIVGILALYYEPLHGSHEAWICVTPEQRRKDIGYQIADELAKGALAHGIRILRADATLAYTFSQKFIKKANCKVVGYVPMSFSFVEGKSLGTAVMAWHIFDPTLVKQLDEEENKSLDLLDNVWNVHLTIQQ